MLQFKVKDEFEGTFWKFCAQIYETETKKFKYKKFQFIAGLVASSHYQFHYFFYRIKEKTKKN